MTRTDKTAKNAFYGTLSVTVSYLIPFVLRTLLLRILGEQYLGLNNLFHSILSVLSIAEAGFGSAITFSLYEPLANGDVKKVCGLVSLYKRIYFVVGSIVLIGGTICIPFLDTLVNNEYPNGVNIILVYIIYLLETVIRFIFFAHKEALLNANQLASINHKISLSIEIIVFILRLISLIALKNYYIFILFLPIAIFIKRLIMSIYVSNRFPEYLKKEKLEKKEQKKILDLSKDVAIHRFGETFSSSLGNIFISPQYGLTAVAIYGNYTYIFKSLEGIIDSLIGSASASVGDLIASEKNMKKNMYVFEKINTLNLWFNTWCSACLFCLYRHFMVIWVTERLTADIYVSLVFTVLFYIENCRRTVNVFKTSAGLWKSDRYKSIISGIINTIISLILIKRIGFIGATISLIIVNVLIFIPWECNVLFSEFFNESPKHYYYEIIKNVFVTVIATYLSYVSVFFITNISFFTFLIKGSVVFVLSNAVYYLFYKNDKIFLDVFKQIINEILKKKTKLLEKH